MLNRALLDRLAARRALADAGDYPDVRKRRAGLERLLKLIVGHRENIVGALHDDLGKSAFESCSTELLPLVTILRYLIRKLPSLAKRRRCGVSWMNFPAAGYLTPEPYGLVLVVATWNYPLLLALEPFAGACGAGSRVVLKLKGRAPRTAGFIQ